MNDVNLMAEKVAEGSHSPGPWKVHPRGRSCPGYDVCDRIISNTWTGRTLYSDGMSDADARLIAAAPELLEAAKRLRRVINDHVSLADVDALDAAIAKAEGRS